MKYVAFYFWVFSQLAGSTEFEIEVSEREADRMVPVFCGIAANRLEIL